MLSQNLSHQKYEQKGQSQPPNNDDRPNSAIGTNNLWMHIDLQDKEGKIVKNNAKYKNQPRKQISLRDFIPSCRIQMSVKGFQTCLGFSSTAVVLGIVIALMVYHFADKELKLSSVSGGLDYIAFNLNSDPIIELIAGNPVCSAGYETIHLGRWPGTHQGCNCPFNQLTQGMCEAKDDLICTDVSDIDEIDMFKFEGSTWCAKRAQLNVDYVKAASCSNDYQQCSPGICIKKPLSCPITSVKIQPDGDDSSKKLNTGKYITVTREQGKSPLIDIDISLNNLPCFSMNEIPNGGGDYILLKRMPEGCGRYGVDTSFSAEIAWTTEDQVFTFNNFPATVLDLPKYREVFQITPVVLAARMRIATSNNKLCLSIDTKVISDAADAAESLNRYVSGTAIAAMVIHGILSFAMFGVAITLIMNHSCSEVLRGKESGLWLCFYIPLGLMELIVFVVMTGLVGGARNIMNKSTNYLITLDKAGCFPSGPPRNVIGDYDDLVNQTAANFYSFSIALLSITVASYVFIVIVFLCKKCR